MTLLEARDIGDARYVQTLGSAHLEQYLLLQSTGLLQVASLELEQARNELAVALTENTEEWILAASLDKHEDAFDAHIEATADTANTKELTEVIVYELDMVAMAILSSHKAASLKVPTEHAIGELLYAEMYSHRSVELRAQGKRPHRTAALMAFRGAALCLTPVEAQEPDRLKQ